MYEELRDAFKLESAVEKISEGRNVLLKFLRSNERIEQTMKSDELIIK